MNDTVSNAAISEPMIDSRQAANALRLPYYWFADCKSTWKTFQGSGVFNIEYFPPRNCVNIWRFAGVTWGDR